MDYSPQHQLTSQGHVTSPTLRVSLTIPRAWLGVGCRGALSLAAAAYAPGQCGPGPPAPPAPPGPRGMRSDLIE